MERNRKRERDELERARQFINTLFMFHSNLSTPLTLSVSLPCLPKQKKKKKKKKKNGWQVHRSPGFITSNLIGQNDDGSMIKEFEASHGTVADMWEAHLAGEETSLNPLGMVEALVSAMQHATQLEHAKRNSLAPEDDDVDPSSMDDDLAETHAFASNIRNVVHRCMVEGQGTRDLCGPEGLTTEDFVAAVGQRLLAGDVEAPSAPITRSDSFKPTIHKGFGTEIDVEAMKHMFDDLDLDGNGTIDFDEFTQGLSKLGVQPRKLGYSRVGSPVATLED